MTSRIVAAVAALTLGATVLATSQAQAHHFHGGWGPVGFGFAAGALLGATVAGGPYYVTCHWVRQYDQWGNFIGRAKVCG